MKRFPLIALIVLFIPAMPVVAGGQSESPIVQPGESAPVLKVSKWVQGAPVEEYESGRIYVLDLWSSWCKPCIESMPKLRAIEAKYDDRVTMVGMNVWEFDQSRVPAFIESHADVMLSVVAIDSVPEGKMPNEGLVAFEFLGTSEKASIPKTVIVDQHGRVAWIGLPDDLEETLVQVIDGTWELESLEIEPAAADSSGGPSD